MKLFASFALCLACICSTVSAAVPPPLPEPRAGAKAVSVQAGVFVFGGVSSFEGPFKSEVLFLERGSQAWKVIPGKGQGLNVGDVTAIGNRIFATVTSKPSNIDVIVDALAEFDYRSGEWKLLSQLSSPSTSGALVGVETRLYVIGGFDSSAHNMVSVEEFDLGSGKWSRKADMPRGRHAAQAVIQGDMIYLFGGVNNTFNGEVPEVDRFDMKKNEWSVVSGISYPAAYFCALSVGEEVVVIDGAPRARKSKPIQRMNMNSMTVTPCGSLSVPRHHATAVQVDSEIWVIGGAPSKGGPIASIEVVPIQNE